MNNGTRRLPFIILAVLLLLGGLVIALSVRDTTNKRESSLAYAPGTFVHGARLEDWSARHWQWTLSFPVSSNPGLDASGESCGYGQSGPVFFIPRNLPSCIVPAGASILLPIAGTECSTHDQFPFAGSTEKTLRSCASQDSDRYTNVSVTVDGAPISAIERYRTSTPLFSAMLPDRNILAAPAGSAWIVADGYQVILQPLPTGEHTVIIHTELADGTVLPDKLLILSIVAPTWEQANPASPGSSPTASPVAQGTPGLPG